MIDQIRSDDPIRRKIETLGTTLSLPTVRKALGILEGAHASNKRFGADDVVDIHAYEPGDEAKRIDWKTSARAGRPMVVQRERPSTSKAWLLLDVGQEMTATCPSSEQAYQVAANALCMFAALSLRRGDEVSMCSATALPSPGCRSRWPGAVRTNLGYGIAARVDQAPQYRRVAGIRAPHSGQRGAGRHRHRGACVGGTAFERIRTIARTHPMVLIDVATINPFDVSHARVVLDGAGKRRVPAFLRRGNTAGQVRTHREYLAASIRHELNRCGSTVIRSDSSERMFHEFVRMVSTALAQSTRNQLRAPSVLSLGDKA